MASFPRWLAPIVLCVACGSGGGRAGKSSNPSAQASDDVPEELLEPPIGAGRSIVPEAPAATLRERPKSGGTLRCDARAGICVHGGTAEVVAALLSVASDALEGFLALGLPRPLIDGARGGDPRLDIYLDPASPGPTCLVDPGSASFGVDKGTAFIVAPPPLPGCRDENALASAVAQAILSGQDAALDPASRKMLSDYLAMRVQPCEIVELEAIDTAQRAPERTFVGDLGDPSDASFLFPWFLEDRYGTNEPGKLTVALAAISAQKTKKGAALVDEPDVFDALRVTQQKNGTSLAETVLEFAIHRAFMGSRSDEAHMVDVAKYGDAGRVRIDWSVEYSSLPRTLKPLRPIEPLGATYVYVDLSGAAENSELTFVVDWEPPVGFRWAIVKLDADGSELGRKLLYPVLGSQHLEASIRDFGGAKSLLIVGINEGESRRDLPFDPGRQREPARSYLMQLVP